MPSPMHAFTHSTSTVPFVAPDWVPEEVTHYIAHVEFGAPLRELARASGVHASTIMRQVRRVEGRREDPLVDAALRALRGNDRHAAPEACEVKSALSGAQHDLSGQPDDETLNAEALRVLRRLCETGAVLAVVPDMEKAVVVRETPTGATQRIAVVDTAVAQAMALKDWIACKAPGRIARYAITATGRTMVGQLLAEAEQKRAAQVQGLAEAPTPFDHAGGGQGVRPRRVRYGLSETPLSVLGRRRDRSGKPFLDAKLVAAGERLREDFELAQMEPHLAQDWRAFLVGGVSSGSGDAKGSGSQLDAKRRLEAALSDLGPGLGDVALRCCCHLEGLEAVERELGWAARSGKIVLRIALERLARLYATQAETGGALIG